MSACLPVRLELPLPPTVNSAWRALGRGRVVLSAEQRQYRAEVARVAPALRLDCALKIRIVLYVARRGRAGGDIDGRCKSLLDALQHAGVYLDDNQLCSMEVVRLRDRKHPHVKVELEETRNLGMLDAWNEAAAKRARAA